MALLSSTTDAATRRLPKLVSSDLHRTVDYVISGVLIVGGAALLRRDRRAAYASLICGGSLLGLSLATNYPGTMGKPMNFARHGKAEMGMAILLAELPKILRFEKRTSQYFAVNAAALIALDNLTHFHSQNRRAPSR